MVGMVWYIMVWCGAVQCGVEQLLMHAHAEFAPMDQATAVAACQATQPARCMICMRKMMQPMSECSFITPWMHAHSRHRCQARATGAGTFCDIVIFSRGCTCGDSFEVVAIGSQSFSCEWSAVCQLKGATLANLSDYAVYVLDKSFHHTILNTSAS